MRSLSFAVLLALLAGCLCDALVPPAANAHSCACPLKGACCRIACPLPSAGRTMRSCSDQASRETPPLSSPWAALPDLQATPFHDRVVVGFTIAMLAIPVSGIARIPEQPPRSSFLALA